LKPFKQSNKVHETLITYAGIGSFFSWLTAILLKRLGEINNDRSEFLKKIPNTDIDFLPFATLFFIIFFTIVLHFAIKLAIILGNRNGKSAPRSEAFTIKNTINGGLAFFSVYPFLNLFVFLLIMLLAYNINPKAISLWIVLVILSPLVIIALFSIWRFPKSIIAVHPQALEKIIGGAFYTLLVLISFTTAFISKFGG
jgi:hypothetical protein